MKEFENELYMIQFESGHLMRSGRNNTIAVFDNLSSAKAQVTRYAQYGGKILVISKYDDLNK